MISSEDRCLSRILCGTPGPAFSESCSKRGYAMTDYAQARRVMVDRQVRTADVTDLRIIAALLDVPREAFVPAARRAVAYLDLDVPVNESGRALLKPMVFAKLLQA